MTKSTETIQVGDVVAVLWQDHFAWDERLGRDNILSDDIDQGGKGMTFGVVMRITQRAIAIAYHGRVDDHTNVRSAFEQAQEGNLGQTEGFVIFKHAILDIEVLRETKTNQKLKSGDMVET